MYDGIKNKHSPVWLCRDGNCLANSPYITACSHYFFLVALACYSRGHKIVPVSTALRLHCTHLSVAFNIRVKRALLFPNHCWQLAVGVQTQTFTKAFRRRFIVGVYCFAKT